MSEAGLVRLDTARRAVVLDDGELTYDYLILAAGVLLACAITECAKVGSAQRRHDLLTSLRQLPDALVEVVLGHARGAFDLGEDRRPLGRELRHAGLDLAERLLGAVLVVLAATPLRVRGGGGQQGEGEEDDDQAEGEREAA